jgi:hypothetical protein
MSAAEVMPKSPFIPLLQRGKFFLAALTPLCKRGEGEICWRNDGKIIQRILNTPH